MEGPSEISLCLHGGLGLGAASRFETYKSLSLPQHKSSFIICSYLISIHPRLLLTQHFPLWPSSIHIYLDLPPSPSLSKSTSIFHLCLLHPHPPPSSTLASTSGFSPLKSSHLATAPRGVISAIITFHYAHRLWVLMVGRGGG